MTKQTIIFATTLLFASSVFSAEPKKNSVAGQYQIIPVEYNAMHTGSDTLKKAVIKLDSTTGRTWILEDFIIQQGKKIIVTRRWVDIDLNIETELAIPK